VGGTPNRPEGRIVAEPTPDVNADIADLTYEQARDELVAIVAKLEGGQAPLEASMELWRRGDALATHCSAWLDSAQAQIDAATVTQPSP
jgi:exodeoxyribonuclease VII small subunit